MGVPTFVDRYVSTLASGYTSGGTSISVSAAPSGVSGSCNFYLIVQAEGGNTEEVFLCTNISGTTLTVVGAMAGTSASNHGAGAIIIGGIDTKAFSLQQGWILLAEQTASNSAELDFLTCITSDFDDYQIRYQNLLPATNGATIGLQLSTNGGSTYSSSTYVNVAIFAGVGAAVGKDTSNTSNIAMSGGASNSSNHGASGVVDLFGPGNSVYKQFLSKYSFYSSGPDNIVVFNGGEWQTTTSANAFRVIASSGNLASGIVRVYGLSK